MFTKLPFWQNNDDHGLLELNQFRFLRWLVKCHLALSYELMRSQSQHSSKKRKKFKKKHQFTKELKPKVLN